MNSLASKLIVNKHFINTRSYLRKNTFGRKCISLVSSILSQGYENSFQAELLRNIKPGDIVWDIGANVGYYTEKMLNLLENKGKVIAIEPSPRSAEACRQLPNRGNLIVIESALGSAIGTTYFSINQDNPTSPTNRLSESDKGIEIKITTGDNLLQTLGYGPNIIKIDVEGYEIEVLKGMQEVLGCPDLRAIFIEVHSQILEENGYINGIKTISETLINNGFHTNWTDFSHIQGIKK